MTKDCLESLVKHTHYPHRLILVDNGSQQETMEYLKGLKDRLNIEILLIRNEQNAGFVRAVNQGMKASTAPYVCLLSNDTLFGNNWLGEMVEIAKNNAQIGIVNPSTNKLGQSLDKDAVECHAKGLKDFKGQWQEMGQGAGFCMLVKREVIDRIGFLDEIFSPYFFEETDFCRRALRAGFRCVMAKASYVYHIGSATLKKRPKEREEIYKKNYDIFCQRWGRPLNIAYLVSDYPEIKQDRINKITLSAARDNHHVQLFIKKSLRESRGMPDHYNVRFFWLSDLFYHVSCIYKILKRKRKKKIEIIFVENRFLNSILRKIEFYHKEIDSSRRGVGHLKFQWNRELRVWATEARWG